jgi:8-oxo-dGTP pyrophosphatase MutT (NUDIX family)
MKMKKKLMDALLAYNTLYSEEIQMVQDTIKYLRDNEIYLGKGNEKGHITGSAWILNQAKDRMLLTHHFKLNMWVQLGGHTELEESVFESAYREGVEESGLAELKILSENIFDVDVHLIPKRGNQSAHYHYDIRYLFEADETLPLEVSEESHDVNWIAIDAVGTYTKSRSVLRMVEKTRSL